LVHLIATSEKFKKQRIGIVHSTDPAGMRVFAAVKDQLARENLVATRIVAASPSAFDSNITARQFQITNCDVILSLIHAENSFQLLKDAAKLKWYPSLLINNLASSAAFELPIEFNQKIYFSLPIAPGDQSQAALAELGVLRDKYRLSSEHIAIQLAALAAAKTFVEAMKSAGPAPTREKLIAALEALNNYSNGLTPPLTFGPYRRMGSQGAHISTVDLENQKFLPSPGWVELK
jgi:ABC-type branched-subunit amino acid transport system substrate-binding protein